MAFTSAQVDAMPGLTRFKASTIAQSDNTTVGATAWVATGDTPRTLTTAGSPKYRTSTINSKPGVTLTKASFDRFTMASLSLSDFTIIPVHKGAATTSDNCFISKNDQNMQIRVTGAAGPNNALSFNNGVGSGAPWSGTAVNSLVGDLTTARVSIYRRKDNLLSFIENGTQRGHAQWSNDGSATVFNEICSLNGNPFFDGTLCELLIFSRALSWTEIVNVLDYTKAEYNITPAIVPTTLTHPARPVPLFTDLFRFQNAAAVNLRGLPIIPGTENFIATDIDTIAHFNAAIASKIPAAGSTIHASIDAEINSPCIPAAAADYAGATWNSTNPIHGEAVAGDHAYLAALYDLLTAARPSVKKGVYLYPAPIDTVNFISTDGQSLLTSYAEAHVLADLFDCFTRGSRAADAYAFTNSLIALLLHGDEIQPELYDKNMNSSQAMLNAWFTASVQLCRDLQDYWGDGTRREVWPLLWLQQVPGAVGATIPAFTGATWTESTKTISSASAIFNALTLTGNTLYDRVYISGGTGATIGHYVVSSIAGDKKSAVLVTSIGAGANGQTDIAGSSTGVFQTPTRMAMILLALKQSGADGAYVGGDAQPAYYMAPEWQAWVDTALRPAFTSVGMAESTRGGRNSRISRVNRVVRV